MSLLCPCQEGNQLFLKQGFINIAKCKACSKEDKQESKMLSSFPGAYSPSPLLAQTQVEQSLSNILLMGVSSALLANSISKSTKVCRAQHFYVALLQISDSRAAEGLRVEFSLCLPHAFMHRCSHCLVAHMNLSVVLHMLGQDSTSLLSFFFSRIQKVQNDLNCPSKIPTQAPVPYGSFSTLKSPSIPPLEDLPVQLL